MFYSIDPPLYNSNLNKILFFTFTERTKISLLDMLKNLFSFFKSLSFSSHQPFLSQHAQKISVRLSGRSAQKYLAWPWKTASYAVRLSLMCVKNELNLKS